MGRHCPGRETPRHVPGFETMELGGLEPPTSWVRSTKSAIE